jgi:hypothetical protein
MGLLSFLTKPRFIKVQAPPKHYVKTGTVTVQFVADPEEIRTRCDDDKALACSMGSFIIMPDIAPLTDSEIGALLRHEVAHSLGGWHHEVS